MTLLVENKECSYDFSKLRKPSIQTIMILQCLLIAGDKGIHGYGLMSETEVKKSTVYDNLSRLLKKGFISTSEVKVVDGKRQISYSLTDKGREYFQYSVEKLFKSSAK